MQDADGSLRKLWTEVQAAGPSAIEARLEEARRQFPDIPFDAEVATNGALFRTVCLFFLKHNKPST